MERKIIIAIADDHDLIRGVINAYLITFGWTVTIQAKDGQQLLDALAQAATLPDILILDAHMPVLNGFDTALQVCSRWPSIKIIGFSTDSTDTCCDRMLACGATAFLQKDGDPDFLQQTISGLLN